MILGGEAGAPSISNSINEAFVVAPSSEIPPTNRLRLADSPSIVGGETNHVGAACAGPGSETKARAATQRESRLMLAPARPAATRAI